MPQNSAWFPTSLSYLRSSTKFFLSPFSYFQRSRLLFYSIQGPRESLLPPPPPLHCQLDSNTPHDCPGTRSVCDDDAKKGFSVPFLLLLGRTNMISAQRAIKSQSRKSSRPLSHARTHVVVYLPSFLCRSSTPPDPCPCPRSKRDRISGKKERHH